MSTKNSKNVTNDLVIGVEEYLDESLDYNKLLDMAAESWSYAEMTTAQARPTIEDTKELIRDIVKGVVKDISVKYRDISVVTMAIITDMFLEIYWYNSWVESPAEFIVPKKMVIALIYRKLFKEVGKRA